MFGKLHFGNNPKGVDDFMILPGQRHGFGSMSEYFFWLKADFFSKHFLDKKDFSVDMNIINQDIPQN